MTRIPYTDGGFDCDPNRPLSFSYELDADEAPSLAVVRTVATLTDTDPLDLEPLYSVIDPTQLDELFRDCNESTTCVEVTFVYHGFEVTVVRDAVQFRVSATEDDT